MKYDNDTLELIISEYKANPSLETVEKLAEALDAPTRSIIAKLSSLGVYIKKTYKNKRGEVPVKKEEYLTRIAELMQVNLDQIESLEKVNKHVLILLEQALKKD